MPAPHAGSEYPLHLAGGHHQIHCRVFYGAPGHALRGAPVEAAKA